MANHKRGRSKNRRAGCLLCKPWKVNGVSTESKEGEAFSNHKRRIATGEEMNEPQGDDKLKQLRNI